MLSCRWYVNKNCAVFNIELQAKIQKAQLSKKLEETSSVSKRHQQSLNSSSKPKAEKSTGQAASGSGEGLLHKARKQQVAIEAQNAREAAVQAYRLQKQQHPGGATMQSLGRLAAQGAERLKQQQSLFQD
jgi:hypothetical protein